MQSSNQSAKDLEKRKIDAINAILLKSTILDEMETALKTFMCDPNSYRNIMIEKYNNTLPPTIFDKLLKDAEECFNTASLINDQAESAQNQLIQRKVYLSDIEKHLAESTTIEKLFKNSKELRESGNQCLRDAQLIHKVTAAQQLYQQAGQLCAQRVRLNIELSRLNALSADTAIKEQTTAVNVSLADIERTLQEINRKLDEICPTDYSILYHSLHYAGATSNRNELGKIATQAIDTFHSHPKITPEEKLLNKIIEFYQILNDAASMRERVVRPTNSTILRSDIDNFLTIKREQPNSTNTIYDGKKLQAPENTQIYLQSYYKRINCLITRLLPELIGLLEKKSPANKTSSYITSLFSSSANASTLDKVINDLKRSSVILNNELNELETIIPVDSEEPTQIITPIAKKQ